MKAIWRTARVLALTCLMVGTAGVAAAQPPDTGAARDGFVPVAPGDLGQEQLPATPLVFAAYAFVWVAVLAYVFVLWRRIARVEHELAEVAAKARRA